LNHEEVVLDGESLTVEDVVAVARNHCLVRMAPQVRRKVEASWRWVEEVARKGEPLVYGVNTGLGPLARVRIPPQEARTLARNLALSHSVGVGRPLDTEVVRAVMLIRANTLAKGLSGVRIRVIETLIEMLNRGVHPLIPEKGSVGASGDLAPLSHLMLVMSRAPGGEDSFSGEALYRGERMSGEEAMRKAGLDRLVLGAKEALALNNGATVSAAIAALALADARNLLCNAQIALAMSLEALRGLSAAFQERLHRARRHPGQVAVALNVRRLIEGSQLVDSQDRVQDAYSLRCAPQVLGAVHDVLGFVRHTVENEINAATDNPLIFPDLPGPNKALCGGNFHGEPLALAMDFLGIAVTEVGSIAERRIFRLLDPKLNDGLPPMLVERSGLHSGFMLAQYTAAALVSDCKTLAHPDSVDSIPTGANQEDHVSMSANAARHAREILWNVERIVGIEMLCAAQALDFRMGEGARPGRGTLAAYRRLRQEVKRLEKDRQLYPDIEKAAQLIHEGEIVRAVEEALNQPLMERD